MRSTAGLHYPDLLVAFGVDPAVYYRRNAYLISEQGKPPDFVLEIASRSTGQNRCGTTNANTMRSWEYRSTGASTRRGNSTAPELAGDQLVDNVYVPVPIEELPGGVLQGYSAVLNLHLRWEQGQLAWYDPSDRKPHPDLRGPARPCRHRARGARQSRSTGPRTRSGTKTAPEPVGHHGG